ncbi:MAG: DUF7716 domain-containing protein [Snodgrassella alvi]
MNLQKLNLYQELSTKRMDLYKIVYIQIRKVALKSLVVNVNDVLSEKNMELMTIREILSNPDKIPQTWLYLPPDKTTWNLDTQGIFSLDSWDFPPGSDEYLPKQAKNDKCIETLDGSSIEDIVSYAQGQSDNVTLDDLFRSFIFYYENDAFLDLD